MVGPSSQTFSEAFSLNIDVFYLCQVKTQDQLFLVWMLFQLHCCKSFDPMVNDLVPLIQKTQEMEPPNSEKLQMKEFELNFLRDLIKMYFLQDETFICIILHILTSL